MCRKAIFIGLLLAMGMMIVCTRNKNPIIPAEPDPHQFIRGRVLLENQTNHAHCPVVLDSLNIDTLTDSSGYYEIFLADSLSKVSGTFKIYFYLYDYDLDSLIISVKDGKVVWGEKDVDQNGNLKTITLQQLLAVYATTDKEKYAIGEPIHVSATLTNKSERVIEFATGTLFLYFYDINTRKTHAYETDITYDAPRIGPGETLIRGGDAKRNEASEGYFIPCFSETREYKIPQSLILLFLKLENQYDDALYLPSRFFVFFDDPKNLHYPLIEVVGN